MHLDWSIIITFILWLKYWLLFSNAKWKLYGKFGKFWLNQNNCWRKKLQLKKIIIKNKLVKECRPSLSTKTIKDVAINFPEVCTFFQINPTPSPKLFSRRLLKLNFLSVCWGNHLTQSWNILGKSYGFCVWENTTLCFDKIIWKQLQLRAV